RPPGGDARSGAGTVSTTLATSDVCDRFAIDNSTAERTDSDGSAGHVRRTPNDPLAGSVMAPRSQSALTAPSQATMPHPNRRLANAGTIQTRPNKSSANALGLNAMAMRPSVCACPSTVAGASGDPGLTAAPRRPARLRAGSDPT